MRKLDSQGSINPLLPALIISILLLLGSAGFGIWAFLERGTYMNEYQAKLDSAIEAKRAELSAEAEAVYNEREKSPYRNYVGPAEYGNINVTYPKTWSAYIDEFDPTANVPVSTYFHPNFIPGFDSLGKNTKVALYVGVNSAPLNTVLGEYANSVRKGTATSVPYAAPQVPSSVGARVTEGENIIVMLPIRDKTLIVQTQSKAFWNDFDTIILQNITFQP